MRRIGHDSTAAAIRYQHATSKADRAIAAGLDADLTDPSDDDDGTAGALVRSGT